MAFAVLHLLHRRFCALFPSSCVKCWPASCLHCAPASVVMPYVCVYVTAAVCTYIYAKLSEPACVLYCAAGLISWRLWYLGVVWVRANAGNALMIMLCSVKRPFHAFNYLCLYTFAFMMLSAGILSSIAHADQQLNGKSICAPRPLCVHSSLWRPRSSACCSGCVAFK